MKAAYQSNQIGPSLALSNQRLLAYPYLKIMTAEAAGFLVVVGEIFVNDAHDIVIEILVTLAN